MPQELVPEPVLVLLLHVFAPMVLLLVFPLLLLASPLLLLVSAVLVFLLLQVSAVMVPLLLLVFALGVSDQQR